VSPTPPEHGNGSTFRHVVFCSVLWNTPSVCVCGVWCDVRLICNHLYSPLLGTDQHNVANRDVTRNNYNTLIVVFTGRCLVAASRFLFFRATSKVQCKVPTPDWRQTDTDDVWWRRLINWLLLTTDDCRYYFSRLFSLCSLWTDRKENTASNNSSFVAHVSVAKETRLPSRYVAAAASSSSIVEAFNIVPTPSVSYFCSWGLKLPGNRFLVYFQFTCAVIIVLIVTITLRFSRCWLWRLLSSGMQCHVWLKFIDVSDAAGLNVVTATVSYVTMFKGGLIGSSPLPRMSKTSEQKCFYNVCC
jgi:hypothetical protein